MRQLALILFLATAGLFAQEEPYVLEATTDKNVFLFFPSPITKALPGNGQFRFGYNQETAEKFGVLKAVSPQGESTLHIITEDHSVYSFIVKYNKSITQFEHFFDGSEAVGNIERKQQSPIEIMDSVPRIGNSISKVVESDYFETKETSNETGFDFAKELFERKPYYKNIFKRQSDVVLRLSHIAYRDDKTYICLTIENQSTLDYDINFIQFNKIAKKASRKSNYQAIEIKPIEEETYQPFLRVGSSQIQRAVYVFDKLSIDKNKLINIELNELRGERNLKLSIGHQYINNPTM
ncbi:DUF4138 domain-containing protein [Flagellimonas hymeniacidonis]|uniref:DUF4138 domain-containing protein n=1 Tax=Flagellimonas hymeniacidonis TaxID=2603628 RepID=A0A5C8V7L7_9FLAO|nr:DUF4138 domain-containing protein [Flagellimonas hymeniacidonis]TXN37711.1 DUF4138 domain-containing protein [Flagellimonas hymeniacidonis]